MCTCQDNSSTIGLLHYYDCSFYHDPALETFILDLDGHGTICASIAAASRVNLKCLEGIEVVTNTIICGANPLASIASYKVFGIKNNLEGELFMEVDSEELLDAIQRSVNDNVGVISISLSAKLTKETSTSYLEDRVNHGTFGAFRENIISCVSAGNDYLSSSLATWVITVGSCNYGGRFYTTIQLGNGRRLKNIVFLNQNNSGFITDYINAIWDPIHLYGDYWIMSGTSAATPVVAGMVSYIRSIHPKWEPGRIKSAIVTTGLVYDLTWDDCRRYLLGRERDKSKLRELRENLEGLVISGENLNLPSFSLVLGEKKTFHRVLTNLGSREEPTI
ncbi:hypothetical protein GQ457_11G018150 [Hibiscus cannabinus]